MRSETGSAGRGVTGVSASHCEPRSRSRPGDESCTPGSSPVGSVRRMARDAPSPGGPAPRLSRSDVAFEVGQDRCHLVDARRDAVRRDGRVGPLEEEPPEIRVGEHLGDGVGVVGAEGAVTGFGPETPVWTPATNTASLSADAPGTRISAIRRSSPSRTTTFSTAPNPALGGTTHVASGTTRGRDDRRCMPSHREPSDPTWAETLTAAGRLGAGRRRTESPSPTPPRELPPCSEAVRSRRERPPSADCIAGRDSPGGPPGVSNRKAGRRA